MSEAELLEELHRGHCLEPLRVELNRRGGEKSRAGAVAEVRLHDQVGRFLLEPVSDAKPSTLRAAIERMERLVGEADGFDGILLLAPHLAEGKLALLAKAGFGGIDLSGNASVNVPTRFAFHRDGRPARFRERTPAAMAYRGVASLVTRLLAREPHFETTSLLHQEVQRRGGRISAGTVSKAVASLEEDRAVGRFGRSGVRVLKPSYLLDRLAEETKPIRSDGEWIGRTPEPLVELAEMIERRSKPGLEAAARLARTGASSVSWHTAFAEEQGLTLYCSHLLMDIVQNLDEAEQTNRFPNIRMIRTQDRRAFFDIGPDWEASPVQAWLELRRGDPRQQEAAGAIRQRLIEDAERRLETMR